MATHFTPAQSEAVSVPLPLEEEKHVKTEDLRIWIGNMDSLLNEYTLVQLLKRCGKVKELDFLIHKSGPLQGQCRGFSFVSFYNKQDAQNAIKTLDGKLVLSKRLHVRWAHEQSDDRWSVPVNLNLKTDLVQNSKKPVSVPGSNSSLSMIKSIEQKLKDLENYGSGLTDNTESPPSLHPVLKQSKANLAAQEAKKRAHPYRKFYSKKKR